MPTGYSHAQILDRRCREISQAFIDAGQAYAKGQIRPATFHSVAELSALELHSQFEGFIEDLFLSCLLGESGIEIDRLVRPVSRPSALDLLAGDSGRNSGYLVWLPIERTTERARKVFRFARPFSRLTYRPVAIAGLKELVVVRNAVAHPSQAAWRKLEALAKEKNYPIARASDYLLAQRDGSSELEQLIVLIRAIGRGLTEPVESDVDAVLGPERRFVSGAAAAPPGNYECEQCHSVIQLETEGELPVCGCARQPPGPCPTCGQQSPCGACSKPRAPSSRYRRSTRS